MKQLKHKKLVLDLAPGKGNARNSEGSFLRADSGEILFAYSRYRSDDWADHGLCDVALVRSLDEGESWSKPVILVEASAFGVGNVMSVSGLTLKDGALCFFFLIKENDGSTSVGRTVSQDGGKTFAASRCAFLVEKGYYVINNDRFLRLSDGRVAVAASWHGPNSKKLCPGEVLLFVSEDEGATFRGLLPRIELPVEDAHGAGLQEPGLLELSGGRVRLWARTALGSQFVSYADGLSLRFPAPQASEFVSPCSPMQQKRLEDGAVFAVYNHTSAPVTNLPFGRDRRPMAIRRSSDGGLSFGEVYIIEDSPEQGFCYPALFPTRDGGLLCAYCRGYHEKDRACLCRLGIMKLREDEIQA